MEFGIAIECDELFAHATPIVIRLEDTVATAVSGRDYGTGLDHVYVGFVILPQPWKGHQRRPFRFENRCVVRSPFGTTEVLQNVASVDAMIDPQLLDGLNKTEQKLLFARSILVALDEVGAGRFEFPDFKFDELRRDVAAALGVAE